MYGKLIEALRAEVADITLTMRVDYRDEQLAFSDIAGILGSVANRLEKAEEPAAAEKPTNDDESLTDEWLESIGFEDDGSGDLVIDCRRGQILGLFTGEDRNWSINRHEGIDSINIEVSGQSDIETVIRLLGGSME